MNVYHTSINTRQKHNTHRHLFINHCDTTLLTQFGSLGQYIVNLQSNNALGSERDLLQPCRCDSQDSTASVPQCLWPTPVAGAMKESVVEAHRVLSQLTRHCPKCKHCPLVA